MGGSRKECEEECEKRGRKDEGVSMGKGKTRTGVNTVLGAEV